MKITIFLIFSMCIISTIAKSSSLLNFNNKSYNIISKNNNYNYIMVIWSLDCPPCMQELSILGKLNKQYSNFKPILISTDSISRKNEIHDILSKYNLTNFNNWIFTESSDRKLRYSIDPTWYGELPRSYIHNGINKRIATSGIINRNEVINWINKNGHSNNAE